MNKDYLDPINSAHMPELADSMFATDFLLRAKESVRNIAIALTETASSELRTEFRKQLLQGIRLHQEITEMMQRKKWFHYHDLKEQYQLDQLALHNTIMIANMNLFPGDTSRKGMFDRTPDDGRIH